MATDLGCDIDCLIDIPRSLATVSGRTNLARAIGRRLQTPRGWFYEAWGGDPDYGFDLREVLHQGFLPSGLALLESQIAEECRKDPRVRDCEVKVTASSAAGTLEIELSLVDADGPFPLVIGVSPAEVRIVGEYAPTR
jgi:hypothetical protein